MNAPRLVVSFLSLFICLLVFYVHVNTSNVALLLLVGSGVVVEVAFILGGILLIVYGRFVPPDELVTGFGRGVCEVQAFVVSWCGIAVYAACMCLAIELLIRTRSPSLLNRRDSIRRGYFYAFATLLIPLVLVSVSIHYRLGDGPLYTPNAICGSIFTIWAVVVYTKRRKTIMRSLASSLPNSFSKTTVGVLMERNRPAEISSVASVSSDDDQESDPEATLDLPKSIKAKSRPFQLRPMKLTRKKSTARTKNTSTPPTPQTRSVKLARRRMLFWSVGYHALISINLTTSTISSIPALKLALNGEIDTKSIDETRAARAIIAIWVAGGLAVLFFLCFGLGQEAMGRYKTLFPFLKRFEHFDIRTIFQRRTPKPTVSDLFAKFEPPSTPPPSSSATTPTILPTPASPETAAVSILTAAGWKVCTGSTAQPPRKSLSGSSRRGLGSPKLSSKQSPTCIQKSSFEEQRYIHIEIRRSTTDVDVIETATSTSLSPGSTSESTVVSSPPPHSRSESANTLPRLTCNTSLGTSTPVIFKIGEDSPLPGLSISDFRFSDSETEVQRESIEASTDSTAAN
ncbi:hypothetical protein HDV05_001586 [Chytridiales sp. JEL 0842]|nr:hypothetical protein HDV05_001586 [Chytridiales sp. JEL 0842]